MLNHLIISNLIITRTNSSATRRSKISSYICKQLKSQTQRAICNQHILTTKPLSIFTLLPRIVMPPRQDRHKRIQTVQYFTFEYCSHSSGVNLEKSSATE